MRKFIILFLMLFVVSGCGDHLDGIVVAKSHEPGYTSYIPQTHCNSNGKTTTCFTTIVPIYTPDCWRIVVKGHDKDSTGDTCTDEDRWINLKVGDQYVGKDVSAKDRKDY